MKKNEIEYLLLSEMEEVNGGKGSRTCVCQNGGAGEIVIVPPTDPEPGTEPDPGPDPTDTDQGLQEC